METKVEETFITSAPAAEVLGVDSSAVRNYLKRGKLAGVCEGAGNRATWRIHLDSVEAFLAAGGRARSGMKAVRRPNIELLKQLKEANR